MQNRLLSKFVQTNSLRDGQNPNSLEPSRERCLSTSIGHARHGSRSSGVHFGKPDLSGVCTRLLVSYEKSACSQQTRPLSGINGYREMKGQEQDASQTGKVVELCSHEHCILTHWLARRADTAKPYKLLVTFGVVAGMAQVNAPDPFASLGCEPNQTIAFTCKGHGPMTFFPSIELYRFVSNVHLRTFHHEFPTGIRSQAHNQTSGLTRTGTTIRVSAVQ